MALTLTLVDSVKATDVYYDMVSFLGEASYTTTGSDFDALFETLVNAGRKILAIIPQRNNGYPLEYDPISGKLLMFFGDNNNAADGPNIEVPATTNLSALTFRVLVISK